MSIKSLITDPATNKQAIVQDDALTVTQNTYPPFETEQKLHITTGYLLNSAGSNDMGIDGSTTNMEFYVQADPDDDFYITNLTFLISSGSQPELYEFADSGSALTNGCQLYYTTHRTVYYVNNAMKANLDFVRLGLGQPAFGGAKADIWVAQNFTSNGDFGILTTVPFSQFIPPYGIKLDRGTTQRLSFLVRDNCTDADSFNCYYYGFHRFE